MSTNNEEKKIRPKNIVKNEDQCPKCKGTGLMKTKFITCSNCDGLKCYKCNERGYTQSTWSECNKCFGTGTLGEIRRPV
jgi:DnaJ-class molecular chaperone